MDRSFHPAFTSFAASLRAFAAFTTLFIGQAASAQMVGSAESGATTPREVKAHELQATVLQGDVDLFTGRYSASYPLGEVSTGGLSFALSLQYSPTIVGSTTPTLSEGIPYGAGWSPNIPTISVSTTTRHAYTEQEDAAIAQAASTENDPTTWEHRGFNEGDGYWYAPEVNIPGVASGRAVFKDFERGEAVFVLNTFDSNVELRYFNGLWKAYLPDGRVFWFGAAEVSTRMPGNNRNVAYSTLEDYLENHPGGQAARSYILGEIKQKVTTFSWHCTEIRDDLHDPAQSIVFKYDGYGKFDMYKELQQANYAGWLHYELISLGDINSDSYETFATPPGDMGAPQIYARDLFLNSIIAYAPEGEVERLEMGYDLFQPRPGGEGPVDMLTTPFDTLVDFDTLYAGHRICLLGGEENDPFSDWKRIVHVKSDDNPDRATDEVSSSDPYLRTSTAGGDRLIQNLSSGQQLAFDHGFLESPRLAAAPQERLFPGDTYEVRTTVQGAGMSGAQVSNIDINIVTGGPEAATSSGGSGWLGNDVFERTRQINLFSTFDRAVKWNTNGSDYTGLIETSNFFVMPDVPQIQAVLHDVTWEPAIGFNVQVGPANSDNNFSMGAASTSMTFNGPTPDPIPYGWTEPPSYMSAYGSYPHFAAQLAYSTGNPHRSVGSPSLGLLSHHPVPHNFGVGLPWSILVNPGNRVAHGLPHGGRPWDCDLFKFWWHDDAYTGDANQRVNVPTLLGPNAKLKELQVWRYSKRPLVFTEVRHYVRNGEIGNQVDPGRRLAGKILVEHECHPQVLLSRLPYDAGDAPTSSDFKKNVFRIVAFHQAPVDPSGTGTSVAAITPDDMPTTRFEYTDPADFDDAAFNPTTHNCADGAMKPDPLAYLWNEAQVLNAIVDPLGRRTEIVYNDFRQRAFTERRTLSPGKMVAQCYIDTQGIEHPEDYCAYTYEFKDLAISLTPTVKELRRSGETSGDVRVTSYAYADKVYRPKVFQVTANYRNSEGPAAQPECGFLHVSVRGPENGTGIRNRMEYTFRGGMFFNSATTGSGTPTELDNRRILLDPIWPEEDDPDAQDFLLFGKLARARQYDHAGHLLVEDSTRYIAVKAFNNAINRKNYNLRLFEGTHDYFDYDPDFDGPLSGVPGMLGHTTTPLENDAFLELEGNDVEDPQTEGYHAHFNLKSAMPVIYLNSYFIRKERESHKEFDFAGCRKQESRSPLPPYHGSPGRVSNPGGPGWTNSATNAGASTLLTKIDQAGLAGAQADLLQAGPLQETVLSAVIAAGNTGNGAALDTVLSAQPALSNARLQQLITATGTIPVTRVEAVLGMQPYLSDPVLLALGRSAISGSSYRAFLLKQVQLSSDVMDTLVAAGLLPVNDTRDVLQLQPVLPDHVLTGVITSATLPATVKADLLGAAPSLSPAITAALIQPRDGWDLNAARELIVHGKTYPDDTALVALLTDPALPDQWLIDVLEASPRGFGTIVLDAIDGRQGVKDGVRDPSEWQDLVTDCTASCETAGLAVENITDYEYYEAAPNGVTDALAYKRLFGFAPSHAPFQLKWNPSWMVFSTQKWSPQMPGAYARDEYYYYQDLRNRYDRHWTVIASDGDVTPGLHVVEAPEGEVYNDSHVPIRMVRTSDNEDYEVPNIAPVWSMADFGRRTDKVYQHRMLTKGGADADPFATNEFYYYFQNWPDVPGGVDEEVLEGDNESPWPSPPPVSQPAPGGGGGGGGPHHGGPPTEGSYIVSGNTPSVEDNCDQLTPGRALVRERATGVLVNMDINVALAISEDDIVYEVLCVHELAEADPVNEPRMIPLRKILKHAFQLRSVHVQVEPEMAETYTGSPSRTLHEAVPLMQFFDYVGEEVPGVHFYKPLLPYEVIDKRLVLERGICQQVVLEQNERGLKTRYTYPPTVHLWHVFNDPGGNYTDQSMSHPLLPDNIIVGYGLYQLNGEQPQITHYIYGQDNSVASITDPNGTVQSYEYDVYGRLNKAFRNGQLLGANTYSYWSNSAANDGNAFNTRAEHNYVESIQPLEIGSDQALRTRSYVDPLGRPYNTIAAAMAIPDVDAPPANVTFLVSSGKADHDPWDRATMAYKPFAYGSTTPFPFTINNTILGASPTVGSASTLEKDPRGRPLFAAKPGQANSSTNPHRMKYRYQFMDGGAFACALGLSASEAHQLMPQDPANTIWRMAEVEDEDGRITQEFTDVFGRKVATLGVIDGGTDAVTLFFFNGRGQLMHVRDPEKHLTRYGYNHLGWAIRKVTVDGGTTRYMYDKSGNVVLEQDADGTAGEPVKDPFEYNVPTYRRYTYDLFNRLVRQERVRLYDPGIDAELLIGVSLSSRPINVLEYTDRNLDLDVEDQENWPVPEGVSMYDFRDRSSLDWLSTQGVFTVHYTGSVLDPELTERLNADLVGDPLLEKEWSYDHDRALEPLFPVEGYMQGTTRRACGRVASTRAFPHLPYMKLATVPTTWQTWAHGRATAFPAVLQDLFAYNADGQLQWQLEQFNPNGIRLLARGILTRLDYAKYDLRGNLRTLNIDVNADGVLDLQHEYEYDAWGRLNTVRAGFGLAGNPEVVSYAYRPESGLLDEEDHYARCPDDGATIGEVDQIKREYDVRDRLCQIEGKFYKEQLYYDHNAPLAPQAPDNWGGGIAASSDTYTFLAATDPPDGFQYATRKGYTYDGLGRLLKADAVVGDATGGVFAGSTSMFRAGDEQLAYDRIGNIRTLDRWGFFNDDNVNVQREGWAYGYGTANSRLQALTSTGWAPGRQYTHSGSGDLLTDDARHLTHLIGRAHLPYNIRWEDGGELRVENYFYDVSDRRVFKQEILGEIKDGETAPVPVGDYYLNDPAGRELGVLDLTKGTWTWYFHGAQRFAHLKPPAGQQPEFRAVDISNQDVLQLTATGPYASLLQCLLSFGPLDDVGYPFSIWQVLLVGATDPVYLTQAEYLALPSEQVQSVVELQFKDDNSQLQVTVNGSTSMVAIKELFEAAADNYGTGSTAYPFVYDKFEDLRLGDLTYYALDHLGNTRVTYTPKIACREDEDPDVAYLLEQVLDYFSYGKFLRTYFGEEQEKFVSTQHERDKETELDYRMARFYDSDVARFLSIDPLADDYASWSAFNYVMGNPIGLTDPDGRECGCPDPPCRPKGHPLAVLGTATGVTNGAPSTTSEKRSYAVVPIALPPPVGGPISIPVPGLGPLSAIVTLIDLLSQPIPKENLDRLNNMSKRQELEKSIRSLTQHLEDHKQKLEAYTQDPDSNDPDGRLKDVPPEVRESIIKTTIKKWGDEIKAAEKNIREANEKLENLE